MYRFLLPFVAVAALAGVIVSTNPAVSAFLAREPVPLFPFSAAAVLVAAVLLFVVIVVQGRAARFVERHASKLFLGGLGGLMLGLAACAGAPALSDPSAVPLTIAKAEYGFEQSYNVAGNAYLAAVQAGLPAATKAKVKPLLQQAYQLVKDARAAQAIGDASGVSAKAAAIDALVKQILGQLPAAATTQQPLGS